MSDEKLTIEVTRDEAELILSGLAEMPFKTVKEIFFKIQSQCINQLTTQQQKLEVRGKDKEEAA